MKFVFDRAVKGSTEGFRNVWTTTFTGNEGPWIILGREYKSPMDWFEFAKKAGRALGITDCECSIDITGTDQTTCTFSFQKAQDYRSFLIATHGDTNEINTHTITCEFAQEKQEIISLLINFIKANDISANITNVDATTFNIITHSRFDNYQIQAAFDSGRLTPNIINKAAPSNTP